MHFCGKIQCMQAPAFSTHELKDLSFDRFSEKLFNDWYPAAFALLKKIDVTARELNEHCSIEGLDVHLNTLAREFECLYHKDKQDLFPLLDHLQHQNTKAENCTPFKVVKLHHTAMLEAVKSACDFLDNLFANDRNIEQIVILNSLLDEFGTQAANLQQIKDRGYYRHFKSCKGCSAALNEIV